MKILCLHGNGTSGDIFASQTSAFRAALGDEHEYVWIDADTDAECAKGLEDFTSPPYYSWAGYLGMDSLKISATHKYVYDIIDEEGPFDGIMGFSQGSATGISMLLQHEIDNPKKAPPFSFAIFFSSLLAVSPDPNFAKKDFEYAQAGQLEIAQKNLQAPVNDSSSSEEEGEGNRVNEADRKTKKKDTKPPTHRYELVRKSKRVALVIEVVSAIMPLTFKANDFHRLNEDTAESLIKRYELESCPRLFHPLLLSERITIPTVHVVGGQDPFKKQTDIVVRLSKKDELRYLVHAGGHDVPRVASDVKAAVAAAQWAIQKSQINKQRWFFPS